MCKYIKFILYIYDKHTINLSPKKNTGEYNIINYPGLVEASPLSWNMYLVNDVVFRKKSLIWEQLDGEY